MGASIIKDVIDSQYQFPKDQYEYINPLRLRDWVKREPPDQLIGSYLERVLPEVARRLEAVETFLEKDMAVGTAFVRTEERPAVGAEVLNQVMTGMNLIQSRLDQIERKLGQT